MASSSDSSERRFKVPSENSEDIRAAVQELLGTAYDEVLGDAEYEWTVDTVHIDNITIEENLKPQKNAALEERSRAVARAQLLVGESRPLIVIGEDNKLVNGHAHLKFLQQELGENHAVVYRAIRTDN